MNRTLQEESRGQHIGWLTGLVGGLLLISLGLELCARQVFGHTDVGTLLWALYLGFWSFVLGTIGFLLLARRWLLESRRIGQNSNTMNGPGGFSHPLSNSEAVNQNRKSAESCTQARESATAVTCS